MKKKVTNFEDLDLSKQYTYADYLTWKFDERVELIKGWIHKMSPAPKRIHQKVEGNIFYELYSHLKNRNCDVYQSPFDVVLTKDIGSERESNTVVPPDICVICDHSKLTEAGCTGAPDLIVEILSGSTAKKDYNEKFNLYEENGVKEYWIIDPRSQTIETFYWIDGVFKNNLYFEDKSSVITSPVFPDLKIPCSEVFS
ncbi:MAG: Uma2 family endonuclease [Nonlabens sp.]